MRHIKYASDGFAVWSPDDILKFIGRHPIGTKARLAMSLLFYTGQRRSDVVELGRQHVRDGVLHFTQKKNRRRKPVRMELPILPQLRAIIDASPCGAMTFLVTDHGAAFTAAGFGNWFRDRCREAGLEGRTAHGLRKALQSTGAEMGLTDRELMAIAGHATEKETTRYMRSADRAKLAQSGMAKIAAGLYENESAPPHSGVGKSGASSAGTSKETNG